MSLVELHNDSRRDLKISLPNIWIFVSAFHILSLSLFSSCNLASDFIVFSHFSLKSFSSAMNFSSSIRMAYFSFASVIRHSYFVLQMCVCKRNNASKSAHWNFELNLVRNHKCAHTSIPLFSHFVCVYNRWFVYACALALTWAEWSNDRTIIAKSNQCLLVSSTCLLA